MHAPLSPERRLLLRAAEVLRDRGHCKNVIEDEHGRVCAMGALLVAARIQNYSSRTNSCAAIELIQKRINSGLVDHWLGMVQWNNAPERTAAEVIEMFEQAALS